MTTAKQILAKSKELDGILENTSSRMTKGMPNSMRPEGEKKSYPIKEIFDVKPEMYADKYGRLRDINLPIEGPKTKMGVRTGVADSTNRKKVKEELQTAKVVDDSMGDTFDEKKASLDKALFTKSISQMDYSVQLIELMKRDLPILQARAKKYSEPVEESAIPEPMSRKEVFNYIGSAPITPKTQFGESEVVEGADNRSDKRRSGVVRRMGGGTDQYNNDVQHGVHRATMARNKRSLDKALIDKSISQMEYSVQLIELMKAGEDTYHPVRNPGGENKAMRDGYIKGRKNQKMPDDNDPKHIDNVNSFKNSMQHSEHKATVARKKTQGEYKNRINNAMQHDEHRKTLAENKGKLDKSLIGGEISQMEYSYQLIELMKVMGEIRPPQPSPFMHHTKEDPVARKERQEQTTQHSYHPVNNPGRVNDAMWLTNGAKVGEKIEEPEYDGPVPEEFPEKKDYEKYDEAQRKRGQAIAGRRRREVGAGYDFDDHGGPDYTDTAAGHYESGGR